MIITIVFFSIVLQAISAIMAMKLVPVTGKRIAWLLIAAAIIFMAVRRIESLVMLLSGETVTRSLVVFETIGLVTSALMFAGIYLIKPLFASIVRSEEELRALNVKLSSLSEEQQLLLEHTKDFIYRHDPQGMITYVSPAVERITGFTPQEWHAHYSKYYTDNPVNKNGLTVTGEMLKTGTEGPAYIVEVIHKNGGKIWLEVNKRPYFSDGKVAGFIGVARDITRRMGLEEEREDLIDELQEALTRIKTLKGLLPICAACKKVRDDKGYWSQIEVYISEHSEAEFSHGICPDCAKRLYPGFSIDPPITTKKA